MTFLKAMAVVYLAMFSAFWAFCFARFFLQLRELLEVREFCHARWVSFSAFVVRYIVNC
jgi:hypothetical protein